MGVRIVAVLWAVGLLGAACSSGAVTDSGAAGAQDDDEAAQVATTESASTSGQDEATSQDTATTDGETGDTGATDDESDTGDAETTGTTDDDSDTTGDGETDAGYQPSSSTTAPQLGLVAAEQGDSGEAVVALQERLAELGFAPGPADGSYGRQTVAAVGAFQVLVDLEPTGAADDRTIAALAEYRYDGLVLHAGDEGPDVEDLQRRLGGGPFDPGPIDGLYGTGTVEAVWALEKLAGVPVDGDWGPLDEKAWGLLMDGKVGLAEKSNELRWVEVDLSEQLIKVYDPGSPTPTLVSHASSGSGIPWANENHSGSSITPLGDFAINHRIAGWRESSLDIGRLYNPLYFNGGIALHGSLSVPLYPASHGCIRLPMHIAEYLPDELPNGTPVHVVA
jgi:peptidoglycan hydrolase-like protein with peptidoglycan-binding domain